MTDELQPSPPGAPIDGAPTWLRAVQAALVGVVAGLALNAVISIVALQARDVVPAQVTPKECKSSSPARDSATPRLDGPAISSMIVATPAL